MTASVKFWLMMAMAAGFTLCAEASFAEGTSQPQYVGVNMAGAEFRPKRFPGIIGKDYIYPKKRDLDYFIGHGFNAFRLPFRWQRLQPKLGQDFRSIELRQIDKVVRYATSKGAAVILDPHNYAKYLKKDIGSKEVPIAAFADFWARLADHYKGNQAVFFGLMNEPHRPRADEWRRAVDAAIKAIRATGARNLILVPGTIWTGAHSWQKPRRGVSNAQAFRNLTDPGNNFAFEVHQYFDHNYSGTSRSCSKGARAIAAMKKMTKWLRANRHRGFLGEFGVADSTECLKALEGVLKVMKRNQDVWLGWTYWAAGAWWKNYPFSVHPSKDGKMKPQLKVLKKYANVP